MTALINVLIVLIVVGVVLFAINNWLPMDAKIKTIVNVIVVVILLLWLLTVFLPGVLR